MAGSIAFMSIIFYIFYNRNISDLNYTGLMLFFLIFLWTLRLGLFLFNRINKDGSDRRFNKIKSEKIVSLILGGPNKYYSFNSDQIINIFNQIKSIFVSDGYKVIIIPSMRTPKEIIDLAEREMGLSGYVVNKVDKQAYLSAYALAEYVVVTCDSTSMISEATTSGKPIFVAHMKAKRNNYRFKKFFNLFRKMGIIRDLEDKIEIWSYNKHNEAQRIALELKSKIEK